MNRPSIFVVGPEGAGTTLLWKCIKAHPELETMASAHAPSPDLSFTASGIVLHLSLPTLRPPRWVRPEELPLGSKVIVTQRSPIHTVYSAYRRFYTDPAEAWRSYLSAVELQGQYVALHAPLCVFYEELVGHPAKLLRSVYEFLGVGSGFQPPVELIDRNDDRWRRDPVFSGFVHRAFGFRRGGLTHLVGTKPAKAVPRRSQPAAPAVRELAVDCYGVRLLVVDETGTGVCGRLRRLLPPDAAKDELSEPGVRYVVRLVGTTEGMRPVYHVLCGDEVRTRACTLTGVVKWLRRDIDGAMAAQSHASLFVHAGVVGWRGRAILIPGRSMTGKSHLVAALARHGATYYSDEYAVLDEQGRVHPYARAPVLRGGASLAWPPRAGEFTGGMGEQPLPIGLIVSTTYQPDAAWGPRVVRGARAVLPIIDNTVLARQEPARLLRLCAKIAAQVVTLQGGRPDAAVVAPRLLQYLDDLLDGRTPSVQLDRDAALLRQRVEAAAAVTDVPKRPHASSR